MARWISSIAFCAALFATAGGEGPAHAQSSASVPDPLALSELDGFVLGLTEADAFAGVVLVAREGHVLLEKAYGRLDAEKEAQATIDARYNMASAGKMFTAVAVLQQIAAGRLTLDTKVGAVLKNYPSRAFADGVTIRHLLTHSAGAGDIALFGAENAANRAHVRSVADMIALRGGWDPDFSPGSKQEYGNYGFVVLGRIVEVLSGESYENYVQRRIFAAAGMTRTGFVACTDRAVDLAVGYATVDGERVRNCATLPARGFPAGGHVSTAADIHRFVRALQTGKLIPAALFADATRTHRMFIGLGFFATDFGPDIPARDFRWGHGGAGDGACADVRTYPRTGETVIVLANRDYGPACGPVAAFLHKRFTARSAPAR